MVPQTDDILKDDVTIEAQPTFTYRMLIGSDRVIGTTDGMTAMEQAVYKILNTERYESIIYPWTYGIELDDLFGQPIPFVCSELKRRIPEALAQDDRITGVYGFEFTTGRNTVTALFVVHTTEGDIEVTKEVGV